MHINMTHHKETSPICVKQLSPISLVFSLHSSASLNLKKTLPLPFSLPSDLSLGLHGWISMNSITQSPWLQLAATMFCFTNSGDGSSKVPLSLSLSLFDFSFSRILMSLSHLGFSLCFLVLSSLARTDLLAPTPSLLEVLITGVTLTTSTPWPCSKSPIVF